MDILENPQILADLKKFQERYPNLDPTIRFKIQRVTNVLKAFIQQNFAGNSDQILEFTNLNK